MNASVKFLGSEVSKTSIATAWAELVPAGDGSRAGVLVRNMTGVAIEVSNLETGNGAGSYGWYQVAAGATFYVPYPGPDAVYYKAATATSGEIIAQAVGA